MAAARTDDPAAVALAIEEFVRTARRPVLVEPGERLLELAADRLRVEPSRGGVRVEAWDSETNIRRKVTSLLRRGPGRLELEVERFPNRRGSWLLVDQARASNNSFERRSRRMVFGEHFRSFVTRQFPGWRLAELSSSPDLEHSLSPAYPRAYVVDRDVGWAAVAAPPDGPPADSALTFGLIWFDYLRRRKTRVMLQGLAVFLPEGAEVNTCLRLRWLNPKVLRSAVFVYDRSGHERPVDPLCHGNLHTKLEPAARMETSALSAPSMRDAPPEAWIEAQLRRAVDKVDGRLLSTPVYSQAPILAGRDRGVMDLLAVGADGRLAVLELKASQDIHLPLQALDYWMRVALHAERDEFAGAGYFPGIPLQPESPRLLLVSPALEFHPSTETLLRFFAPEIEVERIGLTVEWQKERIRVAFRLRGSQAPWSIPDVHTPVSANSTSD